MRTEQNGKYYVLSVTTLASLMAALDATVIYLALPSMGSFFSTSISYLTWVVAAYLIALIATLIPITELIKRINRKALYLGGFLIFAFSSLFVALSPNILFVIVFRFIEGVGAGILATAGIPILLDAFPPKERGRAIGINSISWALGTLIGPIVGGFLVMYDWRYIFLINVPIGIIGTILGVYRIPSIHRKEATKVKPYSSVSLIIFIIPLIIAITFADILFGIIAAILLPVFLFAQYKSPLIPVKLLRNKQYSRIMIASAFQSISFFAVLYSMSVYLQDSVGLLPVEAGLYLFTYPLASLIGNPVSGYLLDKTEKGAALLMVGLVVQGISIAALGYSMKYVPELLFVAGFGGSIFWAPSTTLVVDAAGQDYRSISNGSLFTVRNIALVTVVSFLPIFLSIFSGGKVTVGDIYLGFSGIDLFAGTRFYIITMSLISMVGLVPLYFYSKSPREKKEN